jgi:potassium-transporting ATPase KdpC subunit
MRRAIVTSVLAVVLLHFLLGFVYPMFMTGVGQVAFPGKANGSKIYRDGKLVGSGNLAEVFGHPAIGKNGKPILTSTGAPTYNPDPRYFQPRPSATSPVYNAAGTAFSNLGPNNKATLAEFDSNIQAYLQLERPYTPGLTTARIPVDAVQTSASGVDPDISVANADIQANRIAHIRHLPLSVVHRLVGDNTDGRWLGVLGEPGVNVVKLNLALDRQGQA